ncbi:sensor histidine kinase [Ornithinimicrobium cerasi]|uniref:sensor histidine kinase n=1 Tax=Ornithinimicrobium cerasi TaxID=2248773 RepID=UPI000EFF9968|nr:ATP-binding protein [Ornithinimicrobium cerasi]
MRGWTVRQRLLALMTGLMILGLAVTGTVTFAIQYATLADRVDAELNQEVAELQRIAQAGPALDGQPYTDLDTLFFAALSTAVAGEDEALLAMVDVRIAYVSGGERPFDVAHPDVLGAVERMALPEGRARITTLSTQGTTLRVLAADVRLPEEVRSGTLVVVNDLGRQRDLITWQAWRFALISMLTVALTAGLGHVVLGALLRPLRELREATAEISAESLSRRVAVSGADTDVAELAVRFNDMLDRLDEGVRQQRQFLDDAAHELRTPLTILRGNAELLRPGDPDEVRVTRQLMLDEADRMRRLVDDLLMLARSQRPDFVRLGPTDVTELALETMDRLTVLGDRAWRLRADAEGQLPLDAQRVSQAVVQLAANAVKFSEDGSVVELGTRWVDGTDARAVAAREAGARAARRYLTVSLRDQGQGVPEDQLGRIFDRFGRAENAAGVEGSGLGLPIVEAIARGHGGAVTVESVEEVGSVFTLWFPDGGSGAGVAEGSETDAGRGEDPGQALVGDGEEAADDADPRRSGLLQVPPDGSR